MLVLSIIGNGLLYYHYSCQNRIVEDLKGELSVSNLQATNLGKEKESLQNDIDSLQSKIDDLRSEMVNLRNEINYWKDEVDQWEGDLRGC